MFRATIFFTRDGLTAEEAQEQITELNAWLLNSDFSAAVDDMSLEEVN